MRVRFAPSPTGRLHVGNARTALFNWLLARGRGGTFVLRIEDTDAERSTRESEQGILDDLRWLGLDWDEGPDTGGPYGPYRQSERLPSYIAHAERLIEAGRAYYCFCPAEQIEQDRRLALEHGRVPRYRGTCRDIPADQARARVIAGEPAAVRFRVPPRERVWFDDLVRGRVTVEADMLGDLVEALMPSSPSGGMKNRVGLARASAMEPECTLYDEPTTGLDPIMADVMNDLILALREKLHVTSVTITHDMTSAYKIADRIAILYDGRIIEVGTPDDIHKTANPVVRQFVTGSAEGPITVGVLRA